MSILLNNISFSYNHNIIFHSLNLFIPKGQIWALVGKSGIGKTTLLNIIAGLYKPTTGEVKVNDNQVYPGCIKGIVFQDESLLDWLNLIDNVTFPICNDSTRKEYALDIINEMGLSNFLNYYPFQLSTGMRKRVEFARAILADESYLLLDEPLGTVDAVTRRDLWKLFLKMKKEKPRTGILCTHDPEEAIRLCDTIVTFSNFERNIKLSVFEIPAEIKCLSINEECKLFWELKIKIIAELQKNGN